MVKFLDKVDIEKIRKELKTIPEGTVCLQGISKDQDPYYGTGSTFDFTHDQDKHMRDQERSFNVPLFDIPYTNSIMEKFGMYRARILIQEPKQCYTYHKDYTPRIHIPIHSNENCFFILEDILYRMKDDGSVYYADTVKIHTAVNASREKRTHLVGCVYA